MGVLKNFRGAVVDSVKLKEIDKVSGSPQV